MKRHWSPGLVIGLLAASLAACSGEGSAPLAGGRGDGDGSGHRVLAESAAARARVADLRQRFRWAAPERRIDDPLRIRAGDGPAAPVPVFGAGVVASFEPVASGRVRVHLSESERRGVGKPARVELPARASEPVHLEDETSGMAIDFALKGARDAEIAIAEGIALYKATLPSDGDVVHRVRAEGTEDYVVFERKPEREELTYQVDVSRVAGLRQVADVLEFLDGAGTPRLRVAPPYVVDAVGKGHAAHVTVSGCAVEKDPRAPWGRAVTAPGAAGCSVHVTWEDLTYPAIVDPVWMTTGSMAAARAHHTASVLSSGKVLVAGGYANGASLLSAELYEPSTNTWSAAGSMATAREYYTASVLSSGKVLVAGGYGNGAYLSSAEQYDPIANTWSAAGSMATARESHTASALSSGKVLVAGGHANGGYLSSAEQYDPIANTWSAAGSMATARESHTASVLSSGKVLVAGGDINGAYLSSAEQYDPIANTWSAAGSMATARESHTASVLSSGKVLVAGGINNNGTSALLSAEQYDPIANTWSAVGSMATAREYHTASVFSSGKVLVAGGGNNSGVISSAEFYDPIANTWSLATSMATARYSHTASMLSSGKVLVAGGTNSGTYLLSAELYLVETGSPCPSSTDCQSGFCADGVCCNQACSGACDVCAASLGASADGTCTTLAGYAGSPSCAPFVCGSAGAACPSLCTLDLDCISSRYCASDGTCKPKKPQGALCNKVAGGDCWALDCAVCATGFCADGVCCDTACNAGACDACSLAAGASSNGTCELLTGRNQSGVCTSGSTPTNFYACAAAPSPAPATPSGGALLSALLLLAGARRRGRASGASRRGDAASHANLAKPPRTGFVSLAGVQPRP